MKVRIGRILMAAVAGVCLAVMVFVFLQLRLYSRLEGNWRAYFPPEYSQENKECVESIRIAFFPNGTFEHEIVFSKTVNVLHLSPNASSDSVGKNRTRMVTSGVYEAEGGRVHASCPLSLSSFWEILPFVIVDVGKNPRTGRPFVLLSLDVDFEKGLLIVPGHEFGQKIVFEKDGKRFSNLFPLILKEGISTGPQKSSSARQVEEEHFIGSKKIEQYQEKFTRPPSGFSIRKTTSSVSKVPSTLKMEPYMMQPEKKEEAVPEDSPEAVPEDVSEDVPEENIPAPLEKRRTDEDQQSPEFYGSKTIEHRAKSLESGAYG